MNEDFTRASDEFSENASARKMIFRSLRELLPSKGNRFGFFLSMLFASVFAASVGCSDKTVEMLSSSANTILNVQMGIFSVVLTVYSIIFVFFDDEKLKIFAKILNVKNSTYLNVTAEFYHSALFLYFIDIAITGIIVLLVGVLDNDFRLTSNYYFDTGLAIILLFVYYWFCFRIFYELKSVIYNTIQLFRLGVLIRLKNYSENIEYSENEKKETKNDCK